MYSNIPYQDIWHKSSKLNEEDPIQGDLHMWQLIEAPLDVFLKRRFKSTMTKS
jgi:hypothetical protein